ncbi:MAG: Transglutaminase-like superfamily [Solirubrobacteraceae bacterium]|jgi:hypothetical protein|nr:Transglutaminase-like superfamily [Solirubrobacteraceae bacterium]
MRSDDMQSFYVPRVEPGADVGPAEPSRRPLPRPRVRHAPGNDPKAHLNPVERILLAREILSLYAEARRLLRTAPVTQVVTELRGGTLSSFSDDWNFKEVRLTGLRLATAVTRTLPLLPTDTRCLMRSLVLTGMLARRGVAAPVIIAVKPGGEFGAHAWVEHAGLPLLPTLEDEFHRLVEI